MSLRWLVLGAFVAGLAGARRFDAITPTRCSCDAVWTASDREEARARFEFDVVHREFRNHQREFDSIESSLGVITLVAITLMAVYFPDPKNYGDRVLEIALGCAAALGSAGFMLFGGYEPFAAVEFQRDYRGDPVQALRKFVDKMTNLHRISKRAVRVKQRCGWISLAIITLVEIAVSISRWHSP